MPGILQRRSLVVGACVLAFSAVVALLAVRPVAIHADDAAKAAATVEPVEKDMHEFMEYVFEPTFQRLKPAMASEPVDAKGWKVVKADGLILAEGGNLLLARQPEEEADEWNRLAMTVRKHGGELYAAGKKKDFAAAKAAYAAMVTRCNECHETFAGGEHQLEP